MHGSLLPKYRGRAPVHWAILKGESATGASLHYMVEKPDAGGLVDQQSVPILENDTALDVSLKVADAAQQVLHRSLPKLVAGRGQLPASFRAFGPLATHLRYVERASRKLARSTFYGMARWQAGMERKQGFLGRVVDIGAELFAMATVCAKAEMLRKKGNQEAVALADLFCADAARRVKATFERVFDNDDVKTYGVAKDGVGGKHTWMEKGMA